MRREQDMSDEDTFCTRARSYSKSDTKKNPKKRGEKEVGVENLVEISEINTKKWKVWKI